MIINNFEYKIKSQNFIINNFHCKTNASKKFIINKFQCKRNFSKKIISRLKIDAHLLLIILEYWLKIKRQQLKIIVDRVVMQLNGKYLVNLINVKTQCL